jgi:deoxyribonuclease-4
MLLLGAHTSVSGGYHKAIIKGRELGLSVVQIFTKNQLRWVSKPISENEARLYRKELSDNGEIKQVLAHGSYLYNFSSPQDSLIKQSEQSILDELVRCTELDLPFLVIHPGAHMGSGETVGIKRVISSLKKVLELDKGDAKICLETTAGQGTGLGYKFEHLKEMLCGIDSERIGVCLDTCHIFAAGYDLRTLSAYRSTISMFERVVGLEHLKVIHLNDSKGVLGSRIDRHTHIGRGKIGLKCFKFIMNDDRFKKIPKIIETPKKDGSKEMDSVNLDTLRRCARGEKIKE